jgi:hypothetical protein
LEVNREAATRIVEKQNVDAFIDQLSLALLIPDWKPVALGNKQVMAIIVRKIQAYADM